MGAIFCFFMLWVVCLVFQLVVFYGELTYINSRFTRLRAIIELLVCFIPMAYFVYFATYKIWAKIQDL